MLNEPIHARDYNAIRAIYGELNMIMTPILEEKYRVQRKLAEESGYDVRKYAELCRKIVAETEAE
uniref:Uncharacterized protein n=1 Tax=Candidatus Kentrum sp. FW TaxID=2126338 RepID=A0A450TT21_9GAMM|nr:MAG: hypothetical protein BECKFW1821B_GA0114236_12364 [Candidatus Kentron sp. FW]